MPKILFQNLSQVPRLLAIEPWAFATTVPAGATVEIEFDDPSEIEFAVRDEGKATIVVVSDRVDVLADGEMSYFGHPS